MGANFDTIFSPSHKSVDELIAGTSSVLTEFGFGFQNAVWKLRSIGGNPQLDDVASLPVASTEEAAAQTRRWWGRSLEWFSPEIGEVYLRIFSAGRDGGLHVVYNESRRTHRMREKDPSLQQSLIAMLLQLCDVCASDICAYKGEPVDDFRPASIADLEEAIVKRERWDGEVLIVSVALVTPAMAAELAKLGPLVSMTTNRRYVLNYFALRQAA